MYTIGVRSHLDYQSIPTEKQKKLQEHIQTELEYKRYKHELEELRKESKRHIKTCSRINNLVMNKDIYTINTACKEQVILFSMLQVYKENFKMINWKLSGYDFDNMYKKIISNYYEKITNDLDKVAEKLIRQGVNPPNIMTAITIMENSGKMILVNEQESYNVSRTISMCDTLLGNILSQIEACLSSTELKDNIHNVGIKSWYETVHNEYDLEYRFLNKKRL